MRNSICVICGQEFEPREGKLYCSDKCKQYAYTSKKNKNESITQEEEKKPEPVKEIKPKYRFDYNEYNEFLKMMDSKGNGEIKKCYSLTVYSFYRKNLSGISNIEFIYNYIMDMYDSDFHFLWWLITGDDDYSDEFYTKYIKIRREKYEHFTALFHSGEVEFYDSKNATENTTENTKEKLAPEVTEN
jgi:hypothetical protein